MHEKINQAVKWGMFLLLEALVSIFISAMGPFVFSWSHRSNFPFQLLLLSLLDTSIIGKSKVTPTKKLSATLKSLEARRDPWSVRTVAWSTGCCFRK